jgi:hypothetical protein
LGITVSQLACPRDGGNRPSIAEERGREEKLQEMHDATHRRLQAKRQVAEEVIARRRSLAEAIEQFQVLDQEWSSTRFRNRTPEELGMSEEYEWDGRLVIDQVRQILVNRPAEAAEVAGRMEKELQELLATRKKRRLAPAEPRTERSR